MNTEQALADAKALREQADTLTRQARAAMSAAVRAAAKAGMSARAISRHAGVSHTAVADTLRSGGIIPLRCPLIPPSSSSTR